MLLRTSAGPRFQSFTTPAALRSAHAYQRIEASAASALATSTPASTTRSVIAERMRCARRIRFVSPSYFRARAKPVHRLLGTSKMQPSAEAAVMEHESATKFGLVLRTVAVVSGSRQLA